MDKEDDKLNSFDIGVVVAYFVAVLAVGICSMYRTNRGTVGGYFLAGRDISWWPIGASLFASNVGSGHFIGLAGSGAASGVAVGAFEWNAMFIILLLAWLFVPVYMASGAVTMPEYLEKRFGHTRIQACISFVYLFIYIFTKISVDLYAGAIFISQSLKWDMFACVFVLLVITGLYTMLGGLAAVIYTDTLQTIIILCGGSALAAVAFVEIGGYSGLRVAYEAARPRHLLPNHTECGLPRSDAFHVFRSVDSDMPWTGVLFGMPILSIWYWCTDQVIVQRTLAARNLTHAKGGALMCSYLKVFPMFIMVMVGMISRALYPDSVGCVVPEICMNVCQNPHSCSDIAYPKLVLGLMPQGARGLMIAVMLSALMSSLTSIFNSSSTIFTMDLWNNFRRQRSTERELMIVSRVFVIVLVVISCLWIPIIQAEEGGQLFIYIQKISAYLQPPIAVCFILAVFWDRTNEKGAFCGLCAGTVVGLIRLVIDFTFPDPVCGETDTRPPYVRDVHYLHFAIILATFSALVTVVVSLGTKPIPEEELHGLTWSMRKIVCNQHKRKMKKKTERTTLVDEDQLASNNDGSVTQQETEDTGEGPGVSGRGMGSSGVISTSQSSGAVSYDGRSVRFVNPISGAVEEDDDAAKGGSMLRRVFDFVCGLDNGDAKNEVAKASVHRDSESAEERQKSLNLLEESPFWRRFTNANLVVCLVFTCTMWIVFR